MTARDLQAPDAGAEFDQRLGAGAGAGRLVFETVHRRKDGRPLPMESSVRSLVIDGRQFYQGIIRCTAERKRQEAEIRRHNRLYAVLSQVNSSRPSGAVAGRVSGTGLPDCRAGGRVRQRLDWLAGSRRLVRQAAGLVGQR